MLQRASRLCYENISSVIRATNRHTKDYETKKYICVQCHAPTASMLGKKPSFKLLSNLLISSTDVAFAIAAFTFSASSFDIKRPALPGATTGLGSSVATACFDECVDTVVESVVASCVGRLSAVRNRLFAVCRSCDHIMLSTTQAGATKCAPCREFSGNPKLSALGSARQAIRDTIFFPARGSREARGT